MAVKVTVYGTADMSQIDRARAQLDALEKKAQMSAGGFVGSMSRISASTKTIGDKFSSVGSSMTRNLTLPIAAAGAAIYKATENAAKDAQAQVVLATALKNTTGATDDQIASVETWISKQGELLGVTDDQLRPALSTLVGATKDITKAQTLAGLAMDIAAAKGVDVETASKAVAKAYAGNTTALSRLVPGIDQAALKSKNFGNIAKSVAGIVGGQAANAAGTMAGQMQRNKVAMDESIESLGYAFMPIMQDFSKILRESIVPAIQGVASWFSSLDNGTKRNIVGFGLLLAVAGPVSSVLGGVFRGVSAVSKGLVTMYQVTSSAIGGLQNLWTGLTNAQAGASAFATPMMQLGGHLRNAAMATWQFVTATGASIAAGVRAAATWVATTATMIASKVATMAGTIATGIATAAQWLWNIALSANPIGLVVIAIVALIAIIVLLASNVKGIGKFFSDAWKAVTDTVSGAISAIGQWLGDFGRKMQELASNLVDGFLKGLADFGKKAWDAITAPIRNAVDGVKSMLGIHSPSRVTHEIGVNFGRGFVDGLDSQKTNIVDTAGSLAKAASDTLALGLAKVDRTSLVGDLAGDKYGQILQHAKNLGIDSKVFTDAIIGDAGAWKQVQTQFLKETGQRKKMGYSQAPWVAEFMGDMQDVRTKVLAQGDLNELISNAVGDPNNTGKKIDKVSKVLAEKIKAGAQLAKDAMRAWSMDEVVKPMATSFDQLLAAIQSQIQATADFMNNVAKLKARGLAGGALASILAMGAAQGGGVAAGLANASDQQIAQYNTAYGEQKRLTGILGQQQSGAQKLQAVTISPNAIQVVINGNADAGVVSNAVNQSLDRLVTELRAS